MIKRLPSVRVRAFIAMATALAGFMNILSALFPAFHWRYLLLRDLVPVRVINDSDVATVLLGVVLILLANGLAKRHRRAMQLTLGVLALSAVLHITKGLDYEEALVCLGLAGILFSRRADYVVPSRPINLSSAFTNTLAFGLLYYAYALIGFRILARWITPTPTLAGSALEPLAGSRYADVPLPRLSGALVRRVLDCAGNRGRRLFCSLGLETTHSDSTLNRCRQRSSVGADSSFRPRYSVLLRPPRRPQLLLRRVPPGLSVIQDLAERSPGGRRPCGSRGANWSTHRGLRGVLSSQWLDSLLLGHQRPALVHVSGLGSASPENRRGSRHQAGGIQPRSPQAQGPAGRAPLHGSRHIGRDVFGRQAACRASGAGPPDLSRVGQ